MLSRITCKTHNIAFQGIYFALLGDINGNFCRKFFTQVVLRSTVQFEFIRHLLGNANHSYIQLVLFCSYVVSNNNSTYRKQDVHRHFQSSWNPGVHPCPNHQCLHGPQQCAVIVTISLWVWEVSKETYANDTLSTNKLDMTVFDTTLSVAVGISLDVS